MYVIPQQHNISFFIEAL